MDTQPETTASSFVYNRIPTKVSRKDFNRYIEPHLHRPQKGPKPKLSLYKIFNYILYVLQWFSQKSGGDSAVSSEFVIAGMIFHHSRVKSELLHK